MEELDLSKLPKGKVMATLSKAFSTPPTKDVWCMDNDYIESVYQINKLCIDSYLKINSVTVENGVMQCIFTNPKGGNYIKHDYDMVRLLRNWLNLKENDADINLVKSAILKNSAKGLYSIFHDDEYTLVLFNAGHKYLIAVPIAEVNEILVRRFGKIITHDIGAANPNNVDALHSPQIMNLSPNKEYITHVLRSNRLTLPEHLLTSTNKWIAERPINTLRTFSYDNFAISSIGVFLSSIVIGFTDINGNPVSIELANDDNLKNNVQNIFAKSFQSYAGRIRSIKNYMSTASDYRGIMYVFIKGGKVLFAVGTITNGDVIRTAVIPNNRINAYMDIHKMYRGLQLYYKDLD